MRHAVIVLLVVLGTAACSPADEKPTGPRVQLFEPSPLAEAFAEVGAFPPLESGCMDILMEDGHAPCSGMVGGLLYAYDVWSDEDGTIERVRVHEPTRRGQ